jgi:hypothetical protein
MSHVTSPKGPGAVAAVLVWARGSHRLVHVVIKKFADAPQALTARRTKRGNENAKLHQAVAVIANWKGFSVTHIEKSRLNPSRPVGAVFLCQLSASPRARCDNAALGG